MSTPDPLLHVAPMKMVFEVAEGTEDAVLRRAREHMARFSHSKNWNFSVVGHPEKVSVLKDGTIMVWRCEVTATNDG